MAHEQQVDAQEFLRRVCAKAHESHTVKGNRELGRCAKCGSVVTLGEHMRLHKLAKKCEPAGARGKQNLKELGLGVNPLKKRPFQHL